MKNATQRNMKKTLKARGRRPDSSTGSVHTLRYILPLANLRNIRT